MPDTKKLKRTTAFLFGIIAIILLIFLVQIIWSVINLIRFGFESFLSPVITNWTFGDTIATIIGTLIFCSILIISLTFLLSIRRDETPFNHKTVKKLKVLGTLLIVHEIQHTITQLLNPIVVFDGYHEGYRTIVTVSFPWDGFVIATGLVIYCISLVLEHGITLQTQVDETL